MDLPAQLTPGAVRQMRRAMSLSLGVGVVMLLGKVGAYLLTGSAAILSDAAESVVHVIAVGFATFSLWLSTKPADRKFSFGYERITFFSAGFEGAVIVLAAGTILYTAILKWLAGIPITRLGEGALIITLASVLNGALGVHLVRTGRKNRSLILEANGKHVLTDCMTSVGVIVGLALVWLTGWKLFDPICAIIVGLNILWSGGKLFWGSVKGLMDYSDPEVGEEIRKHMNHLCDELGLQYHGLRFRNAGLRWIVDVHLLFPFDVTLGDAHRLATELEKRLATSVDFQLEVVTHLESVEDHAEVHSAPHHARRPD